MNTESRNLLDKLYNLRGQDSVVLVSMEEERKEAIATKERTSILTSELRDRISKLEKESTALTEEGDKFKEALKSINKSEFNVVINSLNIDFNPQKIVSDIETRLPKTLENIESAKAKSKEELVKVEDEMNNAAAKIEELSIRKDEALNNQERLNKYFDLALDGNINITRDEITSLLGKFNFTEEEQRAAAKILMFPEDGLFDYDRNHSEISSSMSIKDILNEPKVNPAEVIRPVVENEINVPLFNDDIKFEEFKTVEKPFIEPKMQNKPNTKEDLINLLSSLGYDYLDFTSNDFEKLLANYDAKTISDNTKYIKDLGITLDFFADNIELLYDKEMTDKIKRLTSIGKMPKDIYLNPNILIKYDLSGLNNAINALSESGLEPKNVPLIAY